MADSKDKKNEKWCVKDIVKYLVLALFVGGLVWFAYSKWEGNNGKVVSFKAPEIVDSIVLTTRK